MKPSSFVFSIFILLSVSLCNARPPKVIRMYPENGAVNVKSGPIKIRILFDQDMNTGGMSICGSGENFPDIIGKPRWTSKRAFVVGANLKPNHDYSFSINCPSAQNFKSVRGEPAEIYPVPGLIIDVRANGGGAEPLAQAFAGCFIDEPKLYAKHVYVDKNSSNGLSNVHERILQPNKVRPQYQGKITVLTGPVVMSSCEAFVLMMKQVPGCKIIGETTQGSSGNPKPHDLGNGVTVYLPSWQAMLPNGTCFEGKGIQPDVLVKVRPEQITTKDPVIEAALKILRKGK